MGLKEGRKEKPINFEILEQLVMAQNSKDEIASFFDMSDRSLEKKISKHYGITWIEFARILRNKGNLSIRTKQFKEALKGNNRMLELWGKLYLGQNEVYQEKPRNDDLNDLKHQLMILQAENDKLRAQQN